MKTYDVGTNVPSGLFLQRHSTKYLYDYRRIMYKNLAEGSFAPAGVCKYYKGLKIHVKNDKTTNRRAKMALYHLPHYKINWPFG